MEVKELYKEKVLSWMTRLALLLNFSILKLNKKLFGTINYRLMLLWLHTCHDEVAKVSFLMSFRQGYQMFGVKTSFIATRSGLLRWKDHINHSGDSLEA